MATLTFGQLQEQLAAFLDANPTARDKAAMFRPVQQLDSANTKDEGVREVRVIDNTPVMLSSMMMMG